MHFSVAFCKRIFLIALLPWFAACGSIVPGMHIDTKHLPEPAAEPVTLKIREITPELLRTEKALKAQIPDYDISSLLGKPKPYLIGNGDLLAILVWNHPEFSIASTAAQALTTTGAQTPSGFVVDHDGIVQFPTVGPIKLAGLTELQARNLLANRLLKSIKEPDITLRVQSFRSKRIYVDGEVKSPGNQIIDDVPMTLLEGITRAGGFLPSADQSHIVVTRAGVAYPINLPLLVRKGIDPSHIMLASGDVVRVRSRDENKVYVLGEVVVPKALAMNNGRLTLSEALGEAGGLSPLSSHARQVYVVRKATEAEPIVYNLDATSPVALALADNFELDPRDVVYVDAAALARFNRVISLIVPTAASVTSAVSASK